MTEQPINQKRAKSPRISRKKELTEAEMAPSCGQMSVRQLDHLSLEKFWQTNDADWPDAQQKLVPELRKWFARKRKNALANFLCGEQVEQLSPEVTLVLTAAILKEFKPRSVGVQVANLMGKLIDRGNFLGLTDLCPPAIAVLTVKRPSPFRSERWSSRVRQLKL